MRQTILMSVGAVVLMLLCLCTSAAAQETAALSLSANDLAPAQITEVKVFDKFTINAKSDKGVTIEAVDKARTAADGEVFNARIKLNGSGAAEYRSISFTVKAKAKLTIYLCSSSKTDARTLKLVDAKGTVIADIVAPPDDEVKAGTATVDLPDAGTYTVYSAGSGINIYGIVVK
jgi:pectate disaccharide-lyase